MPVAVKVLQIVAAVCKLITCAPACPRESNAGPSVAPVGHTNRLCPARELPHVEGGRCQVVELKRAGAIAADGVGHCVQ